MERKNGFKKMNISGNKNGMSSKIYNLIAFYTMSTALKYTLGSSKCKPVPIMRKSRHMTKTTKDSQMIVIGRMTKKNFIWGFFG